MHEWYAAPMEGLTGWRWRQVQHEMFGGAALYVTPFVSPNGNFSFQRKELEELDPERNRGIPVVPQILTNRAEYFVWAAKECRSRGWEQVDLNLGCPSGTVTGKKKGAGLLRQPELLALLETYPICRLTVHPRVRTQFYKGAADREVFRWTAEHTALPLCYNGDVTTVRDLREMGETFPNAAVMVGRGLVADPSLLRQATGGPAASLEELREFHDRLYGLYCRDFSGDVPVLHHMRELWNYFSRSFRETDTLLRQVRKAGDCRAYETAVRQFFYGAELSH